jgi:Family of unknown function (DUF6247)
VALAQVCGSVDTADQGLQTLWNRSGLVLESSALPISAGRALFWVSTAELPVHVSSLARMAMTSSAPDPDPRAIREALTAEDVETFEVEYRQAMAQASDTLDLNPVLDLLERWRRFAWSAQDPVAHRRMLAAAARLDAGEDIPTEPWAETRRRLGI